MSRPAIDLRLHRYMRRTNVYVGGAHVAVELCSRRGGRCLRTWRGGLGAEPSFDTAMTALAAGLAEMSGDAGDLGGLVCDVVLADRWLVYDIVALDVGQVSRTAANAAVTATLADTGGTRGAALDVRWQWQRDGASVFAMGLARTRLLQLSSVLRGAGLALRSVTGEFVAIFNAQRARLGGERVVFAVRRDGDVQWALLSRGTIRSSAFDVACRESTDLARIAIHAMRARGEDTAADLEFVVDAGVPDDANETPASTPGRWTPVRTPDWAVAA